MIIKLKENEDIQIGYKNKTMELTECQKKLYNRFEITQNIGADVHALIIFAGLLRNANLGIVIGSTNKDNFTIYIPKNIDITKLKLVQK